MSKLSWRIWPLLAGILTVFFVAWDLLLVDSAARVQRAIDQDVELLNSLGDLNEDIQRLGRAHQRGNATEAISWDDAMDIVNDRLRHIDKQYQQDGGIADLSSTFATVLHDLDSLHAKDRMGLSETEASLNAAMVQFMVQRARGEVENIQKRIHEVDLRHKTDKLSERWDQAQVLLFLACFIAVVFAYLVGRNGRFLYESRLHGEQLLQAKQQLEVTNAQLRKTMLSKEEKEVMLKEIHHRVKNNLQIVKSLVRFQMDQVEDPDVRELFNECITRVGAMALVHEQTYLTDDLANIDVGNYLDRLVRDLTQAYTIDTKLRLDVDIRTTTLSVDTLIPLGLIINEIISNSLKYAFRDRSNGTILVHITGSEQEGLNMRIGDDGVGLPDTGKWDRPNTLGMELIHTLSGQLDAEISLLPGPGTTYTLSSERTKQRKVA